MVLVKDKSPVMEHEITAIQNCFRAAGLTDDQLLFTNIIVNPTGYNIIKNTCHNEINLIKHINW